MRDQLSRFFDRKTAGRQLALALEHYAIDKPIIVGLTRGGVPVAAEVAHMLRAPLDLLVVRKVPSPHQPEFGVGALAEGDVQVVDTMLCHQLGMDWSAVKSLVAKETTELDRRIEFFRQQRPRMDLRGRLVIIVDDGLATGSTAHAAIRSVLRAGASRVVLAVPVGSREAVNRLREVADEVVCLAVPTAFMAVGNHYDHFAQVNDEEVLQATRGGVQQDVTVPVGDIRLPGILHVPQGATQLVIFAHGSGSSRHSPRNRQVADLLHDGGIGTLLMDLLTESEALDRRRVFDVELLADRLEGAITWCRNFPETEHLSLALFGASTGAAAALVAAAHRPEDVASVVSRGGRPDLAGSWLDQVRSPTLLIVGGDDDEVLRLNLRAQRQLRCRSEVRVIPGATHLFEEPGTLYEAARAAREWFANTGAKRAA